MSTILIIDDEKSLLGMLRQALTKYGYDVETADNGKEGIQKLDQGQFDVVITDISMAGIDGNGVVQHIRNTKRQSTSIIGISGTPWLFEDSNFDTVIAKPFSIKSILSAVRELTAKKIIRPPSEAEAFQI